MGIPEPLQDVFISLGVITVAFLLYHAVQFTRRRGVNTQLWGTVFESLSHYVQPQEQLKEPKQQIVKQKRQAGDDLNDATRP